MPFLLTAVAAVFLQVISNQKFIGYALFIVVFVLQIVLRQRAFRAQPVHLCRRADADVLRHERLRPLPAAVGLVQQLLGRVRRDAAGDLGGVLGARHGAVVARSLESGEASSCAADRVRCWVLSAIAFVAIGSWIFYNTNVLNEYLPSDVVLDRQARFEKEYRKYKDLPQPRIIDVYADVDIYPARAARRDPRALSARQQDCRADPRPACHAVARRRIARDVACIGAADLGRPLRRAIASIAWQSRWRRARTMELRFEVERAERGFTNTGMPPSAGGGDVRSRLNYNGSFFNSIDMFPHLGYNPGGQILDRNERRKRGLGDVPRAAKLEDESARGSMGFQDADWINFETVVSTSADQIALAPGYLQREWTQGGAATSTTRWIGRCWRSSATCRRARK